MPQIFLLAGTTTWTVPDDCVSASIDTIGAGAGGDSVGGAGGGGAWSGITGLALTPRAVITVAIGTGGATGSAGGDTWFNGGSLGVASVGAKGGSAPATTAGGAGGASGSRPNLGNTSGNSGGSGGSVATGNPGGGGGAGGSTGIGSNGANGGVSLGGGGGGGDNGSAGGGNGGAGSASGTNPGQAGTEYDGSHGSGGGGGGSITSTGGAGGNYGGGGAGSLVTGGVGASGLIVINYISVFINKHPAATFVRGDDDPLGWVFTSQKVSQSLVTSLLPKVVLRPTFMVPRPPDDSGWQGSSKNVGLIAVLATPFMGQSSKFNYVEDSLWNKSFNANANFLTAVLPKNIGSVLYSLRSSPDDVYGQYSSRGKNLNLISANNPFVNPLYKFGSVDSDSWQQVPVKNQILVGVPFKQSTWTVRNIDDPSSWQSTSKGKNLNLISVNTPFVNPPYSSSYSDSDIWQQLSVKNQNLFITAASAPFKQNAWSVRYTDSDGWQQSNTLSASTFYSLLNASTSKLVLRPTFYVPRPPDDVIGQYNYNGKNLNLTAVAGTPFKQNTWSAKYNLDVDVWQQVPVKNQNLFVGSAASAPFKQNAWNTGQDDSSNWQQSNALSSATFYTLLNVPIKNVLRSAFYTPRPPEDVYGQYSSRGKNINLVPAVTVLPFTYSPWLRGFDDPSSWQYGSKARNLNLASTVVLPFTYSPWLRGPDDSSDWRYSSRARNLNLIPAAAATPFVAQPQDFFQDDYSIWRRQVAYNLSLISTIQFPIVSNWYLDAPDDSALWQKVVLGKNQNLIPTAASPPFVYAPWQFGQDDSDGWQQSNALNSATFYALLNASTSNNVLRSAFYAPRPPEDIYGQYSSRARNTDLVPAVVVEPFGWIPWKFGFDDSSGWQYGSKARNLNLVPVIPVLPFSFSYSPWLSNINEPSGWQFNSKGSSLLVPTVTAGGLVKTRLWPYTLIDHGSFWLGQSIGNSKPLIFPPQTPPIRDWIYSNSIQDESSTWQGTFWQNPSIIYPPVPLDTDPRFVCTPLALNAKLPSNQGSGRIFVTTPQVTGMPYGNDFSTIDPAVEKVTLTFNFDPWLAPGVTVSSVVSVTATSAKQSFTLDPNPQAIVSGGPQIGPVPPAFPGVLPGVANRAVLQQVANCQPGVYLLQCLVLTSDNQELNLAAHLPCTVLN